MVSGQILHFKEKKKHFLLFHFFCTTFFLSQFNPSAPVTSETAGLVTSPQLSDQIHCVVFVIDGSTVDVMPERVIEKMNTLQKRMNQRGM
jgi:hypothetical protein